VCAVLALLQSDIAQLRFDVCEGQHPQAALRTYSAAARAHLRAFYEASDVDLCALDARVLRTAVNVAKNPRRTKKKTKVPPSAPARDGSSTASAPDSSWTERRMQDENGQILPDALTRAQGQVDRMKSVQGRAAAVGRGLWTELGPVNISGRVRSMLVDPRNPSVLYAGGVRGGIWKSTTGGSSWSPLNDFLPNMSVTAMVFDPTNPDIIWAGTGEDTIGGGIYRSTDAGAHWAFVPGTDQVGFRIIRRLAIAVVGGKTVVTVATGSGLFATDNNGASWRVGVQKDVAPTLANTWDVEHDPGKPANMVASSNYSGAGMWYSRDGGENWSVATVDYAVNGRIELAYAPSNPTIVYASVQGVYDPNVPDGALYKSTDGGESYTRVNHHRQMVQGWHNNALWVDPTDANALMFGAVDVFRSSDGGTTIEKISNWALWPVSAHADHHWFVTHPQFDGTDNRTVYLTNDGGVYMMEDYREVSETFGWTDYSGQLAVTQFYGVGGNPQTGVIIGGTQDNGNLMYPSPDGPKHWEQVVGGDGGYVAFDQLQPHLSYYSYVYGMNLTRRNELNGSTAYISGEYINAGSFAWKASPYYIPDAKNRRTNFITPFALDPNVSNTMYVAGYSLWRTTTLDATVTNSSGPAWESVKEDGGKGLSAVAVTKGNSAVVWVGDNDGGLWKTTNATAAAALVTWSDVGGTLPNRMVNDIWIDPANGAHVIVGFGGFSADNLWETTDTGATWRAITGSGVTALPSLPVYSIDVHPYNKTWIYVGTELGLFTSEDTGAHWSTLSEGPVNAPIYDISWVGTTLVLGTFGRGAFTMDFSIPRFGTVVLSRASIRQLEYTVTFTRAVTGVDAADFVATTTGSASARISAVTGSGATYVVTVDVPGGVGVVSLGRATTVTIVDTMGQNLEPDSTFVAPSCVAHNGGVGCTSVVTSAANSGAGSLRSVIEGAAAGATILFSPTLSGQTIALTSALVLTKSMTIDATLTNAQITIDGGGTSGLFNAAAPSVTLNGLHMVNGYGGQGGALWNAGTLLVRNSSITGSRSSISGAAIFNTGTATFVNTTIYDNTANSGYVITNENDATMNIVHTTISGNTAPSMVLYNVGVLSLKNSIIADSVAMQCYSSSFYGTISIVNTIIEDRSCKSTLGGDPKLAVAALNGAKTYTKALNTGSNAINAANDSVCASALVGSRDQRGALRPAGARCDIGAYEANGVAPTATAVRVATATRTKTTTRTRTRTATPRPPARTATRTPTRRVP
jgi:hypothetical protein